MTNCLEGCGFSQVNAMAVQNLNRVHEIMSPVVESGLPMQSVKPKRGYGLLPFMFEVTSEDGQAYLKLKSGIMSGDSFIEVKVDPTDNSAVWYEQGVASAETDTTAELAANGTVLHVTDVSVLGALTNKHTIVLNVGAQTFIGRVASIDAVANTITLKAWPSIKIPAGTCVSRGAYYRPQDCVTTSDNEGTIGYEKGKYKAFFRKIEATVTFDSNTDATLSSYTFAENVGLTTAVEFLKAKKSAALIELNRQINYAMFYDKNYGKNTNPAFPNSSETMGIFPRLDEVEATIGIVTTFDFGAACCTDEDECGAVQRSIETFMDYIDYITKSGFYGNTVVVGVNEPQIVALRKLKPYFENLLGYVITTTPATGSELTINRNLDSLVINGTKIDFRYEPTFDKYKIPFMFAMPEDSVYFAQKQYNTVEMNGSEFVAKKNETTNFLPELPIFRVIDLTPYTGNGIDPCRKYHIDAEIAIVRPFTDKIAYMRFLNFGSCLAGSCATCISDKQLNAGTGTMQMIEEYTS